MAVVSYSISHFASRSRTPTILEDDGHPFLAGHQFTEL
jgi:hypothetical protein